MWDSFDEINFGELPDKFVLKANHGSGMNLIVKDKSRLNMAKAKKMISEWMNTPYAYSNGFELQYKNIPRKIIAEQYIEEMDGNLYDYKIHCFMGKPTYIQVIGDRNMEKHTGFQGFFDTNWNLQDFTEGSYPVYGRKLPRPGKLGEMLGIAEKLAREFQYVRVDLYCIEDNIKFGELTFTPASGVHLNWKPEETDEEWGKLMGEVIIKGHGRKAVVNH